MREDLGPLFLCANVLTIAHAGNLEEPQVDESASSFIFKKSQ